MKKVNSFNKKSKEVMKNLGDKIVCKKNQEKPKKTLVVKAFNKLNYKIKIKLLFDRIFIYAKEQNKLLQLNTYLKYLSMSFCIDISSRNSQSAFQSLLNVFPIDNIKQGVHIIRSHILVL